jgi:hypothetical protein
MPLQRESLFGVRWRPDVLDSEAGRTSAWQ